MPIKPTKSIGVILRIVVISCTTAIVFKGLEFTHVKNQITANPVITDAILFTPKKGKNTSKYPTKATAIAAFVHQIEIQYPQATKNPGKFPKPNLV